LLAVAAVFLAYGMSFVACTKVFQGIRAMSYNSAATRPAVVNRRELIYFSSDVELNEMGRVVFYPIVRPLELLHQVEFLHDARGMKGFEGSMGRWLVAYLH
jgi:hypothetical protein